MQRLLERVSMEQARKEAERARFSLDKLIRGKDAVELPDDYELPKLLEEQKDSLSKIFEQFKESQEDQVRKRRDEDRVA